MCPPAFGRNLWELVSSACVSVNNKTTNHRDWEERETVQLLCVGQQEIKQGELKQKKNKNEFSNTIIASLSFGKIEG